MIWDGVSGREAKKTTVEVRVGVAIDLLNFTTDALLQHFQ